MRCVIEVNESVTDGVLEGMVNGTTAFVPDGAIVEGDRSGCVGGR